MSTPAVISEIHLVTTSTATARVSTQPTLICDLAGLVDRSDPAEVIDHLRTANGGHLRADSSSQTPPVEVLERALHGYTEHRLGEGEYVREVRAGLGWTGDDLDLVEALGRLTGSVDIGVMEVLIDLRDQGWLLVGLNHTEHTLNATYADQLGIFDHVVPLAGRPSHGQGSAAVPNPRTQLDLTGTDPRFFARVRRLTPPGHGSLILVTRRPALALAARNQGFEAHLFAGAAALRRICLR